MKVFKEKYLGFSAFAGLAFSFGLVGVSATAEAAPPANVLENIEARGIPEQAMPLDENVVRRAFVQMNKGMLVAGEKNGAPHLKLQLFSDVIVQAKNQSFERRNDESYTWFGGVEGDEHGNVVITVEDGKIAGLIIANGKTYRIQELPSGNQVVRELDTTQFKDHDDSYSETEGQQPDLSPQPNADTIGSTQFTQTLLLEPIDLTLVLLTYVDVLFVYTDDIYFSTGFPAAEMQNAIDVTNQSYANSGIYTRLRKVGQLYANYDETGNSATDLARIQGKTDGYLDWVHWYRDYYKADIVSFWLKNTSGCGRGYIMTSVSSAFEENAFNIVKQSCAVGNLSFAHEVGHNMGARHDTYVDATTYSPYAYNHGYVNVTEKFRTVMSYNDRCDASGVYCTRVQHFSNPNKTYNGFATGFPYVSWWPTWETNNAKTLNNTDYTVSLFR